MPIMFSTVEPSVMVEMKPPKLALTYFIASLDKSRLLQIVETCRVPVVSRWLIFI